MMFEATPATEESTELIVIEDAKRLPFFLDEAIRKPLLDAVKAKADSFKGDVSTAKGRKEIASFSYLIAQAKTKVEKIGKDLSAEQKELPKRIDAGRSAVKSFFEDLQEQVRKPLNEWEAEQARIKAEEEARIEAERLATQKETDHEAALLENELFDMKKTEEKRLAEEARLKREEEIRREAAENARKEAEAKLERERLEAARREAQAKIDAENAKKAQEEAEARAKAQAEQAERDRIAAAEQAERDRIASVEAERKRLEKIEADKEAERLKREADEKHRNNVKESARLAFMSLGFSSNAASLIIDSIESGSIPNVKIEF